MRRRLSTAVITTALIQSAGVTGQRSRRHHDVTEILDGPNVTGVSRYSASPCHPPKHAFELSVVTNRTPRGAAVEPRDRSGTAAHLTHSINASHEHSDQSSQKLTSSPIVDACL
jgi:hypothetical protein